MRQLADTDQGDKVPQHRCGADHLTMIAAPGDDFEIGADGGLSIGGCDAASLLNRFGSPLLVTSRATLTGNLNRFRAAFMSRWPAPVRVFYATKCNPTLAIRAIMRVEGADMECFSAYEYAACLRCGFPPERIIVNGSSKDDAFVAKIAASGSVVNIDSEDEIELLEQNGHAVPVCLRLKLMSDAFDSFDPAFFKTSGSINDAIRRSKWGFSRDRAAAIVARILASPRLRLLGYSAHVGRFSNLPAAYAAIAQEMVRSTNSIANETGFWPQVLNLGGGWARQREPESRSLDINPHGIEDYAEATTRAIRETWPTGRPLPELWFEPGRYIVGNAVTLLTTVGSVREDLGRIWAHVDASTNDLMRIETSNAAHAILPASRMNEPCTATADIVGPTCIPSLIGRDRPMPPPRRGDILAVLDAGMYAEAISNRFNSMPAPANVLVQDGRPLEIRQRETYDDIYGLHRIPPEIYAGSEAAT